jgi:hypothetical protein
MCGKPIEDAFGGHPIVVGDALERQRDRGFDGALTDRIHPRTAFRETQHGASSVTRIVAAGQEPLGDQPLKHSSQRAWVHVQHGRQRAG